MNNLIIIIVVTLIFVVIAIIILYGKQNVLSEDVDTLIHQNKKKAQKEAIDKFINDNGLKLGDNGYGIHAITYKGILLGCLSSDLWQMEKTLHNIKAGEKLSNSK